MKTLLLFSICILLCLAGCKKHNEDSGSSNNHIFKGIVVTNEDGTAMGIWGTEDGDWGNDINWTTSEYGLLHFPDTISLDGTYISDTTGWNIGPGIHEQPRNFVSAFPNPFADQSTLVFGNYGYLKLKVAIVDSYYHRLQSFSLKWTGHLLKLIDLSDISKYPNGVYRIFYSFSATNSPDFYKGHGDLLVCRGSTWQECKNLVP
jgi:hypothetical protein